MWFRIRSHPEGLHRNNTDHISTESAKLRHWTSDRSELIGLSITSFKCDILGRNSMLSRKWTKFARGRYKDHFSPRSSRGLNLNGFAGDVVVRAGFDRRRKLLYAFERQEDARRCSGAFWTQKISESIERELFERKISSGCHFLRAKLLRGERTREYDFLRRLISFNANFSRTGTQ